MRPDDDLGVTNKYGFRNIVKEGDENRVFGVSTIRYDIPKPKLQSVADPIVWAMLYRIMEMRLQLYNYYSPKNLTLLE